MIGEDVMAWLFGEICVRCGNKRTKETIEGLPTCDQCALMVKSTREEKRHCPIDGAQMNKEVVEGVIIDRCASCGGIWLDGGELELVKRAMSAGAGGDFATGMVLGMAIG